MANLFTSRTKKDLLDVLTTCELSDFCKIYLSLDGDLTKWLVKLNYGSIGDLDEDHAIYVEIVFPRAYPLVPPSVRAKVCLPHICVDSISGDICLDILSVVAQRSPYSGWTPSYTGKSIILQLQDFMRDEYLSVTGDQFQQYINKLTEFEASLHETHEEIEYRHMDIKVAAQGGDKPVVLFPRVSNDTSATKPSPVVTKQPPMTSQKIVPQRSIKPTPKSRNIFACLDGSDSESDSEDDEVESDDSAASVALSDAPSNDATTIESVDETPAKSYLISKLLAASVGVTPTQAEKWLREGRVAVNGLKVSGGCISEHDELALDGEILETTVETDLVATTPSGFHDEFLHHLWEIELKPEVPLNARIVGDSDDTMRLVATTSIASCSALRPNAQENAGLLGRLPAHILQIILLMCDASDVGRVMCSSSMLNAVCKDGFLWQPLVQRYFPHSNLVPDISAEGADWRRIWQLEAHGVHYEELRCFFSKKTFEEDVLGVPLNYTINPRTGKIDYISSTMDLLSHGAYAAGCRSTDWGGKIRLLSHIPGCSSTVWGDKILGWLPLFFTHDHFQRAMPLLEKSLLRLASLVGPSDNDAKAQRPSRDAFWRGPSSSFGQRDMSWRGSSSLAVAKQTVDRSVSTLRLTPQLILEVLPRLMNTMVVILVDKGVEHAEEALRGYCQLHRLFVALIQYFPNLAQEVRHRLRLFISDPEARSKSECPNLGELLPLLSVCEEVGWLDIVKPLMEESFARSVLWVCRDVPELAAVAKQSGEKITQELQRLREGGAPADMDMLDKIFASSTVSRRLYSFHCCFLRLVAHPHGAKLGEIARCYDRTFGTPARHMVSKMRGLLDQIEAAKTWPEYFDCVCLRRVSPETLQDMWLRSVRSSLAAGYHTTRTDFSRIQKSGVSSILLRGQSYPRIVLCIDVSGSMGSTFFDTTTGLESSRLDFVKKDLQGIFAKQLSHRQQFTLVKFDHSARI